MKLHEATKQLVAQFGQNVVAEVRLANLLADLNGYQEYPAMKQVFRELLKEGYGQKLYDAYQRGISDSISMAAELTTAFAIKSHFKEDLVSYGFDCLLWALDCIKTINEPLSKGFDPVSNGDTELIDNLPDKLSAFQKQYLDLLDSLVTLPKNMVVDAPAYYSAEALNQLYFLEAKMAAIMEQLDKVDYEWCKNQRNQKLDGYHKIQNAAIEKEEKIKAEAKERERRRLKAERRKKQMRYAAIGTVTAVMAGAIGAGISYTTSSDAIERFEHTIQMGEQAVSQKEYGRALQIFENARTGYDGSFLTFHYKGIAEKHIDSSIEYAAVTCRNLIKQGNLLDAKRILASLPARVVSDNLENEAKIKTVYELLNQAVAGGIDELIGNISKNKGHLDAIGKAKLKDLLKIAPEEHWLNIIKNREL